MQAGTPDMNTTIMSTSRAKETPRFRLWNSHNVRTELIAIILLYALVYIAMVFIFPLPNITADTNDYIYRAQTLALGPYRPLGYSLFLRLLHMAVPSGAFVVAVQYWLNAFASGCMLYAIRCAFPPHRRWPWRLYALLVVCSPVALYLTTFLISDSLFCSLTLLWLATGIRAIHRRSAGMTVVHLALLYLAINVRYIGLFYPAISVCGLLFAWRKQCAVPILAAIVMGLVPYMHIQHIMEARYGTRVFSAMGGWAQASNATVILPHTSLPLDAFDAADLRELHTHLSRYPDQCYRWDAVLRGAFTWNNDHPGDALVRQCMTSRRMTYDQAWVYTGKELGDYASVLRRRRPVQFCRYFLLPSAAQVFYPQLATIDTRRIERSPQAMEWYAIPAPPSTSSPTPDRHGMASLCRAGILALWLCVFSAVGAAAYHGRRLRFSCTQWRIVGYLALFGAAYLGLSVLTHPLRLRYMLPVYIIQITLPYLLTMFTDRRGMPSQR